MGGTGFTGGASHATLYSTASATPTQTDLGVLPGGTVAQGYSINDAGQIVGDSDVTGGALHAFLYTGGGGMQDINSLVGSGPSVTNIQVNNVSHSINQFGQIAAFGTVNGQTHAVLLNPTTPVHTYNSTNGSQDSKVAAGTGYSQLAPATNPAAGGRGTTIALLGGTAGSSGVAGAYGLNRDVTTSFAAAPLGLSSASDVVNVQGSGNDLFVLQLSYSETLANGFAGGEGNAALFWLDPADSTWKPAVFGNSEGSTPIFVRGAYDAVRDFQLGYYGVDTATNTVWAVLDHNSSFIVSAVPEPSTGVVVVTMALLGGIFGMIRARRRGQRA